MGTMNKLKFAVIFLIAVATALSSCAVYQQYAPLNYGDLFNLYPGFTNWLADGGDDLVKWFSNGATGTDVYARPWLDGWAMAVRIQSGKVYGFFMNNDTWTALRDWFVNFGGFSEMLRQLPNILQMPVFVVPVMTPVEDMPCLPGITPCGGLK